MFYEPGVNLHLTSQYGGYHTDYMFPPFACKRNERDQRIPTLSKAAA